jgi:Tol biopolymer transport system component
MDENQNDTTTPINSTPQAPETDQSNAVNGSLPAAVDAVKSLERKKLLNEGYAIPGDPNNLVVKSDNIPVVTVEPKKPRFKLGQITGRFGIVAIVLVVCSVLLFLSMVMGLDTQVVKLTLAGEVVDNTGAPIAGAKVQLGVFSAETNTAGKFSIGGLDMKIYPLNISANGHETYKEAFAVGRGLLNYTTNRTFILNIAGDADISGKLVVNDDPAYKFLLEEIVIGETKYKVNTDGTFKLPKIPTGKVTIVIKSPGYEDITLADYEVKGGEQKIDDIQLKPAGDITGTIKSFLTEELVLDAELVIEGVDRDKLTVKETGEFTFRDLTPGRTYKLRSEAAGYNTRDYDIKIAKGINNLENFRMIEVGLVAYVSADRTNRHIFVADYDGANPKQLSQEKYDAFGIFLSKNKQTVSFASKLELGRTDFYAVSTIAGNVQRVTTAVSEKDSRILQNVHPNFQAEKFASIYQAQGSGVSNTKILDVRGIRGDGSVEIARSIGAFVDVHLSDNGNFITYLLNNPGKEDHGFYRANVNTGEKRKLNSDKVTAIYDISASGKRILYGAYDDGLKTTLLKYTDAETGETVTISNNATGTFYQYVTDSETAILYVQTINSRSNVYRLDVTTNQEEALTKTGNVESIVQQSGMLLYYKANGVYIMDLRKPVEGKLVTDKSKRYIGYEF